MTRKHQPLSSRELLARIGLTEDGPSDLLGDEPLDDLSGDLGAALLARYRLFQERHHFAPGRSRDLEAGPEEPPLARAMAGPAVVLEVLAAPIMDSERDSGSPYFNEPLDLVLGLFLDGGPARGELAAWHFDCSPPATLDPGGLTMPRPRSLWRNGLRRRARRGTPRGPLWPATDPRRPLRPATDGGRAEHEPSCSTGTSSAPCGSSPCPCSTPRQVALFLTDTHRQRTTLPTGSDDDDDVEACTGGRPGLRGHACAAFFAAVPRSVLRRLAAADGAAPGSRHGDGAGRGSRARRNGDARFSTSSTSTNPRSRCASSCAPAVRAARAPTWRAWRRRWASPSRDLRAALARHAPLRQPRSGRVHAAIPAIWRISCARPTCCARSSTAAPQDTEALLATLIEPAPPAAWRAGGLSRISSSQTAHLREVLGAAALGGAVGRQRPLLRPPRHGQDRAGAGHRCGLRAQGLPGAQRR